MDSYRWSSTHYTSIHLYIYTDGSAEDGIERGGSSAVVTVGDCGNSTFLDVRRQYRTEYTTSLEVDRGLYGWYLIALMTGLLLLGF
jgi:hypothetical protein